MLSQFSFCEFAVFIVPHFARSGSMAVAKYSNSMHADTSVVHVLAICLLLIMTGLIVSKELQYNYYSY